jgi:Tfp pilus assembly protein PilZ
MNALQTSPRPKQTSSHSLPTRVTEHLRFDLTLESESHFFAGLRGDVATGGGVFLATYRDLRVGQTVLLELTVDGRPVVVPGTVRWRTPGGADLPAGVGVVFESIGHDERAAIEGFCGRRPPFYFDVSDRVS